MFINFMVLLAVLGMGYWWGMVQGLFSSFLNFICITVAGCIAFALWEPLASVLMNHQPAFAWGVSLLMTFGLSLAVLRVAMDTLIPGNVRYNTLLNPILGSIIGIFSGTILTGVLVIGLSFLTPPSLGGYQAYAINDDGEVIRNDRLWIPVDSIAGNYFRSLSGNTFSSGKESLHKIIPDLARHAALFHFRVDKNSSNVASLSAFRVGTEPIKLPLNSIKGLDLGISSKLYTQEMKKQNQEMMIISTVWDQHYTAIDSDSRIRLTPTQVRLLGKNEDDAPQEIVPSAWVTVDKQTKKPQITHNKQASLQIAFNDNQYDIKWIFLLPQKFEPTHLLCRNNRIALSESQFNDNEYAVSKLLSGAGQTALRDDSPILGKLADVTYNTFLPKAISRSYATGVSFQDGQLNEGKSTVRQGERFVSGDVRVDSIYIPNHQYCIKLRFKTSDLYHLFARHESSPKRKRPIRIFNSEQVKLNCIGYVRLTEKSTQIVNIRRDNINTGEQLPIDDMLIRDELHLYFVAPESNTSMWLKVGDNAQLLRYNLKGKNTSDADRGKVDFKRIDVITADTVPTLTSRLPTDNAIIKGDYQGESNSYGVAKTNLKIAPDKLLEPSDNRAGPKVWVEPATSLIQVKLKGLQMFALLGDGLLSGRLKGHIILEDSNGNIFKPFGTVVFNRQGIELDIRNKPEYKVYDLNIDQISDLDDLTLLYNMPKGDTPVKLIYRESGKPDVEYPF